MSNWIVLVLCALSFGIGLVVGITMFLQDNG